jgi:hypothetical protein
MELKRSAPPSKFDAMADETLARHIEKNPKDAEAIEIHCERLKAKGDLEGYARECEYLLTIPNELTVEEKSTLYNELADLYIGPLARPWKAVEVLNALQQALPKTYQAVLARRRLEAMDGRPAEEEA